MTRPLPQVALDLIKSFEGFSAVPYLCPAGFWTIGYGHLCAPDHPPISKAEALVLLDQDCDDAEAAVQRLIRVPLSDARYGALVDFTFNLGGGALQSSTLRRKVNAGEHKAAVEQFGRWVFASGRRRGGLVRRRGAEAILYASG